MGWIDLTTGESYYWNPQMSMPMASVYKIFTLAAISKKVYEHILSWDIRYPLKPHYLSPGSGFLCKLSPNIPFQLRDYVLFMMMYSDNSAADFLFHLSSPEYVRHEIIQAAKLENTHFETTCIQMLRQYFNLPPVPSINLNSYIEQCQKIISNDVFANKKIDLPNTTTAYDISSFLNQLWKGDIINYEYSQLILKIMSQCQTNSRLPRYIPSSITVAHKTGSIDRLTNDVGIVYAPKGTYVLSLFYNGNHATEDEYIKNSKGHIGDDLLAIISKEIYNLYA